MDDFLDAILDVFLDFLPIKWLLAFLIAIVTVILIVWLT